MHLALIEKGLSHRFILHPTIFVSSLLNCATFIDSESDVSNIALRHYEADFTVGMFGRFVNWVNPHALAMWLESQVSLVSSQEN
jgi:hypothetical protein